MSNRLRHVGYELYSVINLVVLLTENMRARTNPVYTEILDSLRWGRLSDQQLAILNTRVQNSNQCQPSIISRRDSFYRTFVVSTSNEQPDHFPGCCNP